MTYCLLEIIIFMYTTRVHFAANFVIMDTLSIMAGSKLHNKYAQIIMVGIPAKAHSLKIVNIMEMTEKLAVWSKLLLNKVEKSLFCTFQDNTTTIYR